MYLFQLYIEKTQKGEFRQLVTSPPSLSLPFLPPSVPSSFALRFFPFVIAQLLVKQTRKCTGVNYGRRLVEFEHGKTQQLRFLFLLCFASHKHRETPC